MVGAHLWKRILNEGVSRRACGDVVKNVESRIIKAPIITDLRPEQEGQVDHPASRLVAIPFPEFWIEVISSECGDRMHMGCLVQAKSRAAGGWDVTTYSLGETSHYGVLLFGYREFVVDALGRPERNRKLTTSSVFSSKEAAIASVDRVCYLAFESLEFLNCKNVSLLAHDNDPKQVRRAVKRHGGNPDHYRYHTLVYRPRGAHKDSPPVEIGIMPRHMCRGHFQHYGLALEHGHPDGKDRGLLFGKHAGKFYFPPHLRGDKKNGVVEKDYSLQQV